MLTSSEFDRQLQSDPDLVDPSAVGDRNGRSRRELLADSRSPGAMRLREHARDHDFKLTEDAVEAFIRDLRDLMIE